MDENLNLVDMVEENNNEEEAKASKEQERISEYEKILGY